MSTLKYKATERYAMGWTDPRMMANFGNLKTTLDLNMPINVGLGDVPTETLLNLWMVKFGARNVTLDDMYQLRFDDIAKVAQELANRKLICRIEISRMEMDEPVHYYLLEKDDGNN
jgi:hypothetical protein